MGKFSERCRDFSGIYGVSNLPYICEQLMKHGKDKSTPAAIIEQGTTSMQRTVVGTLGTIVDVAKKSKFKNPSMIVIGEVVRFREKFIGLRSRQKMLIK